MRTWLIILIVISMLVLVTSPCYAYKPDPNHTLPVIKRPNNLQGTAKLVYQGEYGNLLLTMFDELSGQYEHYRKQARFYERIDFLVRMIIVVCSFGCALLLGLGRADRSRRVAFALTIVIAAIPVIEQQFHISALHQVSWRTAVDMSRIITDCREIWEASFDSIPQEERITWARQLIQECRKRAREAVDREMDVSLKPIEMPDKIKKP